MWKKNVLTVLLIGTCLFCFVCFLPLKIIENMWKMEDANKKHQCPYGVVVFIEMKICVDWQKTKTKHKCQLIHIVFFCYGKQTICLFCFCFCFCFFTLWGYLMQGWLSKKRKLCFYKYLFHILKVNPKASWRLVLLYSEPKVSWCIEYMICCHVHPGVPISISR